MTSENLQNWDHANFNNEPFLKDFPRITLDGLNAFEDEEGFGRSMWLEELFNVTKLEIGETDLETIFLEKTKNNLFVNFKKLHYLKLSKD